MKFLSKSEMVEREAFVELTRNDPHVKNHTALVSAGDVLISEILLKVS